MWNEITLLRIVHSRTILIPHSTFHIPRKEPLRLLHSGEELVIADGLQQEVERAHLVALKGILLEGGGKDHLCPLRQHVGQLHPVEVGHLDIEEEQLRSLLPDGIDCFYGVSIRSQQLQIRGLGYKRLQQFHRQRLVIDDHTTQAHL